MAGQDHGPFGGGGEMRPISRAGTVLCDVLAERDRQDELWGQQNHKDGTGSPWQQDMCAAAKADCERASRVGSLTWRQILWEEVAEAFAERDPERLRAELIQVSAVAAGWAEAIDRRRNGV